MEAIARKPFDAEHVLHELMHYLPSQTPLKDFIHHNTLHTFQHLDFYNAIFKASKIFGYQVTLQLSEYRELYSTGRINGQILERIIVEKHGFDELDLWKSNLLSKVYNDVNEPRIGALRANWKKQYKVNLDELVHPLLFRVICSYLDQGIALEGFPAGSDGFLQAIAELERNSFTSFFKTPRARRLLQEGKCDIGSLLRILVGDEQYYEQYLFDQQFSHRGWSGMVAVVEGRPAVLLDSRRISLRDTVVFELLLEIDALDSVLGDSWHPLSASVAQPPVNLLAPVAVTELHEVYMLWQDAFEWSYYDGVLAGLASAEGKEPAAPAARSFQAMFCIDERECSLRRYIEQVDARCETFGTPGFFGVEFYFQPEGGKFYDKLCPAPVTPKHLIKESEIKTGRKHELLYTSKTNTLFPGYLLAFAYGLWAGITMVLNIFRPKMSPAISNAFTHMDKHSVLTIENKGPMDCENGLQVGFTVEEMAIRVEGLLQSIGLTSGFSPIVYVIAHGSSSANNPHHGAHDCGACSGRPGSVNARVLAAMANHPEVRKVLVGRGINLPAETQFVGGMHDTAGDEIEFYDEHLLSAANAEAHKTNVQAFENALDLNAKERSRRFASIDTKGSLRKVRKAIKDRSVSLFEPRPELGHGTNSLCIVGRRSMTKGLFLDRRAFLNSYDYRADPDGRVLSKIMAPLGPVCGGINLEYYFSRVDNHKLGAGTKLPHNVMGLIGVANGCDGDLLPGLPLQMIEVHDPVRLLLIVEHYPDVVLKTIQAVPGMYEWYINEWVHLVAKHPGNGTFHYFRNGVFTEYTPLASGVSSIADMNSFVERAQGMETNQVADATRENLPVYLLN